MAVIIFDTNVLLGLYAYSRKTINRIYEALLKLGKGNEFLIPSTVYEEYKRNCCEARSRTGNKYPLSVFKYRFNEKWKVLENKIKNIEPFKLSNSYKTSADKLTIEFKESAASYSEKINKELERLEKVAKEDEISEKDDDILKFVEKYKKPALSVDWKINCAAKAETRIKERIKPGLTDVNKDLGNFSRYGDIFIWYEILEYSKTQTKDFIFVENEKKDDWWDDYNKREMAKSLLEEFKENSPKSKLTMITFDSFFDYYLDKYIKTKKPKIEVKGFVGKLDNCLNDCRKDANREVEGSLESSLDPDSIFDELIGENLGDGSIGEVIDSWVEAKLVKKSASVSFNSYNGKISGVCTFNVIYGATALVEFDRDSERRYEKISINYQYKVKFTYLTIISGNGVTPVLYSVLPTLIDKGKLKCEDMGNDYFDEQEN